MDLNGKDERVEIDKTGMYYVYVLPNDRVIYQDDPDGCVLHVYDLKTGKDVRINDGESYSPIICGDYVYYIRAKAKDDCYLSRINLLTGKNEEAPGAMSAYRFLIDGDDIVFGFAGLVTIGLDEWEKLSEKSYGGLEEYPIRSVGDIKLSMTPDGKGTITKGKFNNKEDAQSIGYNHRP